MTKKEQIMDKKSKNLYITSIVIFTVVFFLGTGVLVYTGLITRQTQALAFQTCYMLIMLCGILGIGSSLRNLFGIDSPKARKTTFAVQGTVLACCAGWLYIIYFTGIHADAFTQAATWIMTAATVNRLMNIITKRRNS